MIMERQIKFRGKQLNGEWAYGDLLRIGGGCIIYIGSKTETQTPNIPKESEVAVELYDNDIAIVIPDTIGQFTGLTDCNGKEIYEGDIVRYTEANDEISTSKVRFVDAAFSPLTEIMWMGDAECEVIGNIHDNPELIPNQPTAI